MTRFVTAIVGMALILSVTIWGPPWAIAGIVLLVAAGALDEFLEMAGARGLRHPGRWCLPVGAAVTWSVVQGTEWTLSMLAVSVILLSIVSICRGRLEHLEYLSVGIAGIVYTCVLSGFLLLMSTPALWVLLGTVWAGDTAAYYGGRLLGRHRLAPVLSPNKTVEGAVAGAVGSLLVGAGTGALLLTISAPMMAAIGLATGLIGQVGDLAESAMKRSAGIKDSANRLPGHGGILDRVDSLLFAAPAFHLFILWAT